MKNYRKPILAALCATLGGCAGAPGIPPGDTGETDTGSIVRLLPGYYSNYAQMHDLGADGPVTDINIRQLKTASEIVFLFTSELRGQDVASYDLYWLSNDRRTRQAAFHFSRLTQDELSLPMQETLSIARQRVVPGCALPVKRAGDRFEGQTDPATCVFEDPMQGRTSLVRSLSINGEALTIKNRVAASKAGEDGGEASLVLQRHHGYVGWASIRLEPVTQQGEPGAWQLSLVFNARDDGRIVDLYDPQMAPMAFGLQLARLPRFEGEPAYFKLSVINQANGQTQAYQWFEPESEFLNMNLDWFQAGLEPIVPADPLP